MSHVIVDEDDYNTKIEAAGDKLVAIDFHAKWCPPCHLMAPYFDGYAEEFPDVVFLKIDVDDVEEVAQKFDIANIPKFVLLKNKVEVAEMMGTDHERLRNMILEHK